MVAKVGKCRGGALGGELRSAQDAKSIRPSLLRVTERLVAVATETWEKSRRSKRDGLTLRDRRALPWCRTS
jgi:hypothetical protein